MLGGILSDLISAIEEIVNSMLESAIQLINTGPREWAEANGIWDATQHIYNAVVPIACSLLVLFFIIGFCENTINVKEQIRIETMFQLLIRISITEYFVIHAIDIVDVLFRMSTGLSKLATTSTPYMNTYGLKMEVADTSDTGRVVLLFVIILMFVVAPTSMFIIHLMLIMRMFRILIAVPFAPMAFSAISSGSHHFTNIAPGYIKYMLSILLETFSISIALSIGLSAITNQYGLFSLRGMEGEVHFINGVLNATQFTFSCIALVILCKAAQNTATKALSLDR